MRHPVISAKQIQGAKFVPCCVSGYYKSKSFLRNASFVLLLHFMTTVLSAACTRLGIIPASNVLTRLSSDRLSLRHALLNPASAAALSVGLSANRCIESLNLGRCAAGDGVMD